MLALRHNPKAALRHLEASLKLGLDGPAREAYDTLNGVLLRHLLITARSIDNGKPFVGRSVNVLVDLYLLSALCYHHADFSILTDASFDALGTHIAKNERAFSRAMNWHLVDVDGLRGSISGYSNSTDHRFNWFVGVLSTFMTTYTAESATNAHDKRVTIRRPPKRRRV